MTELTVPSVNSGVRVRVARACSGGCQVSEVSALSAGELRVGSTGEAGGVAGSALRHVGIRIKGFRADARRRRTDFSIRVTGSAHVVGGSRARVTHFVAQLTIRGI